MPRSDIKNAPYNPRTLSDEARKKLRQNIKRVGYLGGIIWNKRTGNLVSGHQRLSVLDSLEHKEEYLLDVSVVDMDPKTEKEQNIFFNNQEVQGDWDWDKLEKLFKEDGIDSNFTGFDLGHIYQMFGDGMAENNTVVGKNLQEHFAKLKDTIYQMQKKGGTANKFKVSWNDPNFYLVFVFPDQKTRNRLCELLGMENLVWQDGKVLLDFLADNFEIEDEDGDEK